MAFIKVLKMKSQDFMTKYKVTNRMEKIFNAENIRIFAWVFIVTRMYKLYLLYVEELILNDILITLNKKQLEHLKKIKKSKESFKKGIEDDDDDISEIEKEFDIEYELSLNKNKFI